MQEKDMSDRRHSEVPSHFIESKCNMSEDGIDQLVMGDGDHITPGGPGDPSNPHRKISVGLAGSSKSIVDESKIPEMNEEEGDKMTSKNNAYYVKGSAGHWMVDADNNAVWLGKQKVLMTLKVVRDTLDMADLDLRLFLDGYFLLFVSILMFPFFLFGNKSFLFFSFFLFFFCFANMRNTEET